MSKTSHAVFYRVTTAFWLGFGLLLCAQVAFAQQSGAATKRETVSPPLLETKTKASETTVDATIPDDAAVDNMLAPYSGRVHELDVRIGSLAAELNRTGMGSGSLGNFIADGMRREATKKQGAPLALAITNSGGIRRATIPAGALHIRDIFELLPFENKLVVLELSGEQLLNALRIVAKSREAQSGAIIHYRTDANKQPDFVSASLVDDAGKQTQIDPAATYRVVTIDYLLNVSGGRFPMFKEAREKQSIDTTIRDAIIAYVRDETAAGRPITPHLDGRFVLEGTNPPSEEPPR